MDLKKKPLNLFTLWIESFKLANSTFGALFLLIFLFILFIAAALFVIIIVATKLVLPGAMTGPFLAGISSFALMLIASYIVYFIFPCTLINMLAARANKVGTALPECFWKSLLPSFYLLLASIVIAVPTLIIKWLVSQAGMSSLNLLLLAVLVFGVYIPAAFTAPAIALRGENPVSAIRYSMELVFRRYFRTAILLFSIWLMPFVGLVVVLGGLIVGIPLFFANSFDITNLSIGWYAVFLAAALVYAFFCYFAFTANTLLFLNLDYGLNRDSFELADEAQLEGRASSTALPITAGMPVERPKDDILNPNELVSMVTTVSSSTQDANLKEHLDKVYSPDNVKVQQYMHQEEDRMPTILFDDDMAQEIAKNQEMWAAKKEKQTPPEDNGPENIKLSKR